MTLSFDPLKNTRTQRATDKARNEQQKAVLLSEVAKNRCQIAAEDLLKQSKALLQQSQKLLERSAKERSRKRA